MADEVNKLADFLADVVMTSYYLAEPPIQSGIELHDSEMKSLKIISTFGPLKMHALAKCMHVTKPRATQLAESLTRKGLIEKACGEDKRTHLLSATSEGEQIVTEIRIKYINLAESIEHRLGAERTKTLVDLLGEISPLSKPVIKETIKA